MKNVLKGRGEGLLYPAKDSTKTPSPVLSFQPFDHGVASKSTNTVI